MGLGAGVVATGRAKVVTATDLPCKDPYCVIRSAVIVPIVVGDDVVGTLGAFGSDTRPGLIRAATEVARWVSTQVELAELDVSRARLAEAEVRALRAQISPHFIFNALTAIASFVRATPMTILATHNKAFQLTHPRCARVFPRAFGPRRS